MHKLILYLYILGIIFSSFQTSATVIPASAAECNVDFICPLDHFCYKPTGICIQCLSCSSFNRQESVSQSCHELSQDCGDCLAGFREEYLAGKIKRGACIVSEIFPTPSTTAANTAILTTESTATNITSATGRKSVSGSEIPKELVTATATMSVISVAIFSIIGVHFFKYKRRKLVSGQTGGQDVNSPTSRTESSSIPLLPLRLVRRGAFMTQCNLCLAENPNDSSSFLHKHPPPYKEDDHGEYVVVSEERTVILNIPVEKQDEVLLNAVPWKDPAYCRSFSSDSTEVLDEDSGEDSHQPAIDDEETNPSAWIPTHEQRPRNVQETNSPAVPAEVPESDTAHRVAIVPSNDAEEMLHPSQPTDLPSTELLPNLASDDDDDDDASSNLDFTYAMGASSASLQCDGDGPVKHYEMDDDNDEPVRKRTRQDNDAQSLSEDAQSTVPPLLDQNSCSSLYEGLIVIGPQPNRLPPASSDSNLRRV